MSEQSPDPAFDRLLETSRRIIAHLTDTPDFEPLTREVARQIADGLEVRRLLSEEWLEELRSNLAINGEVQAVLPAFQAAFAGHVHITDEVVTELTRAVEEDVAQSITPVTASRRGLTLEQAAALGGLVMGAREMLKDYAANPSRAILLDAAVVSLTVAIVLVVIALLDQEK